MEVLKVLKFGAGEG